MRLMNPGAGEITDRLTILALKILHGAEAGKDVTHFETERSSLLVLIRTRTLNGNWFEQVLDLAATNAALWEAEDDLRGYRMKTTEYDAARAAAIAFRIQSLNDRRMAIIETINKQTGEILGAEKI